MNQTESIKSFVKGLEAYNNYMIKIFNRKINDIDRIIKIILTNNENNLIIKKFSAEFKKTTNINALEPLRTILKYSMDKSKIEHQEEPELFLVQKSNREKINETIVFLTTMLIPFAIASIDLLHKVNK